MSQSKFPIRRFDRNIGLMVMGRYEVAQGVAISELVISALSPWSGEVGCGAVVTFKLPDRDFIIAQVHIRACQKEGERYRLTAEFLELSLTQRRTIREYIAAKSEDEAKESTSF